MHNSPLWQLVKGDVLQERGACVGCTDHPAVKVSVLERMCRGCVAGGYGALRTHQAAGPSAWSTESPRPLLDLNRGRQGAPPELLFGGWVREGGEHTEDELQADKEGMIRSWGALSLADCRPSTWALDTPEPLSPTPCP